VWIHERIAFQEQVGDQLANGGGLQKAVAGQFHQVTSAIKHSRPRERLGANGNLFQRG
jgi:hypothetical protein